MIIIRSAKGAMQKAQPKYTGNMLEKHLAKIWKKTEKIMKTKQIKI